MSATRSARVAIDAYQTTLQRSVECVTTAVVITRGRLQRHARVRQLEIPITFVLANGNRVPLSASPPLYLEAAQDCLITQDANSGGRVVRLVGYAYALSERDQREVVAYQWHPETTPDMVNPHLHVGPASSRQDSTRRPGELHKVHFPTGIVTLEEVIRLAIVEFGVEPRRPDWEAILSSRA